MTLTEFLLARIAEDEHAAQTCDGDPWQAQPADSWDNHMDNLAGGYWSEPWVVYSSDGVVLRTERQWPTEFLTTFDPARVLAECEAKRQLLGQVYEVAAQIDGEWGCCHDAESIRLGAPEDCSGVPVVEEFAAIMALPYVDHPDYNPEWRP